MWIQFCFENSFKMLGAVGQDREIYFSAINVGANLKYRNPYGFAKRHATKDLFKVVPEYFTLFMTKGKRYVFSFEDMATRICETTSHHMLPLERVAEMRKLWYNGYVDHAFPEILPFAPRVAFPLVIRKEGPVPLKTWLNHYVEETLRHFDCDRQILVAPPSVESNYTTMDDDAVEEGNFEEDCPLTIIEDDFNVEPEGQKEGSSFVVPKTEDDGSSVENSEWKNIPNMNTVSNTPNKKNHSFSMVVRAEGMWTFKSSDVFQDVISNVKRKLEELENDYQERDRVYELRVNLRRKEKRAKTLDDQVFSMRDGEN